MKMFINFVRFLQLSNLIHTKRLQFTSCTQSNKMSFNMNHRRVSFDSQIIVIFLVCMMIVIVMTKNALLDSNQEDKIMKIIIKFIDDGKKTQTVGSSKHIIITENKKKRSLKKLMNFDSVDKNALLDNINVKNPKMNKIKECAEKTNEIVTVDGIKHYSKKRRQKVDTIENEFRNLLQMKGVSYIYKRDKQWRTWRKVNKSNGDTSIVCYRCESIFNNCTSCGESGFWAIEETLPPCPYEFFSMINDDELCGIYYNQLGDDIEELGSCPSVIKIFDLTATCDNPIVTKWRFKDFNFIEWNSSIICGAHEKCEILTLYEMLPEYSSFRIVNVKNEVMFSRIMKNGNTNFVCVDNCGVLDPTDMKVKSKLKQNNTESDKIKIKNNVNIEKNDEKQMRLNNLEKLDLINFKPNDKKLVVIKKKTRKMSREFKESPLMLRNRPKNDNLHGQYKSCKGIHCKHMGEPSLYDLYSNSAAIDYKGVRVPYF